MLGLSCPICGVRTGRLTGMRPYRPHVSQTFPGILEQRREPGSRWEGPGAGGWLQVGLPLPKPAVQGKGQVQGKG